MVCSRGATAYLTCLLAATSPPAVAGLLSFHHPASIPAHVDRAVGYRSPLTARSAASDAFRNTDEPENPERSRRDVLRAALALPAGAFALSSSSQKGGLVEASTTTPPGLGPRVTALPSVDAALDLIDASCDRRFLHAVVASDYNFLYRGLPSGGIDARSPTLRDEPCDLLDLATYGSDEAAAYFRDLDGAMKARGSPVLPSNGHLGVTCPKAAAEWGGVAASIWPLGGGESDDDGVHFAWFESGGEFWPRPAARATGGASADGIIVDGIDCGRLSLDDALVGDRWEVLFRADRGFLAVPAAFDAKLREGLRQSFLV